MESFLVDALVDKYYTYMYDGGLCLCISYFLMWHKSFQGYQVQVVTFIDFIMFKVVIYFVLRVRNILQCVVIILWNSSSPLHHYITVNFFIYFNFFIRLHLYLSMFARRQNFVKV